MESLPIYGARTILRRLALTDLERFQAYRTDPEVGLYQGWSAMSEAEAGAFLAEMSAAAFGVPEKWFQLGIAARESNALIGDIGLCVRQEEALYAEIGFTLSRPSQGQGLASEAVRMAMTLLFEQTDLRYIVAITDARNTPSMRLLERLGMTLRTTEETIFRGEPCTEHTYRLDRSAAF